jgi:dTDP-4-dehydrorhamnose 3,5-epimerase
MVTRGAIFDVAVDIRRGSPTFGKWVGEILSDENHCQLLVPRGFAHGFCVLTPLADVLYKCSDYFDPTDDRGILWSDPDIGINWPVSTPVLSAKDQRHQRLKDTGTDMLPIYTRT